MEREVSKPFVHREHCYESRLKVQKLRDQSEKERTELVRSWYALSTLGYGLPGGGVENIGLKWCKIDF